MANRDVWKVKAFRTNMDGRSIMASEGNSVTTQSSEDAAYATIWGEKTEPAISCNRPDLGNPQRS